MSETEPRRIYHLTPLAEDALNRVTHAALERLVAAGLAGSLTFCTCEACRARRAEDRAFPEYPDRNRKETM